MKSFGIPPQPAFINWAGSKAKNGQFADPLTLIPNYIRGPDVTVKRI